MIMSASFICLSVLTPRPLARRQQVIVVVHRVVPPHHLLPLPLLQIAPIASGFWGGGLECYSMRRSKANHPQPVYPLPLRSDCPPTSRQATGLSNVTCLCLGMVTMLPDTAAGVFHKIACKPLAQTPKPSWQVMGGKGERDLAVPQGRIGRYGSCPLHFCRFLRRRRRSRPKG
jgi:hypothetical protein